MGDDESSDSAKTTPESAPYKFKQKDEGVGKKLDRSFSNVSANRKTLAIIAGILILVIVGGTLTGNVIKTSSELSKCQKSLTDSYAQSAELSGNISLLEIDISVLSSNLSSAIVDKDMCIENYTSCTQDNTGLLNEKQSLSADISDLSQKVDSLKNEFDSCSGDLTDAQGSLEKISNNMEELEKKYATYKCCAFYKEGYKFYSVSGKELVCCYMGADSYLCGFGPSEASTPEEEIKTLTC
jgi:methyl-accepting chemotaxis protein